MAKKKNKESKDKDWWDTHFIVDGLPKELAEQLKDQLKDKLKPKDHG